MAASTTRRGELISGINVTPLVDVVLVLLIVLMVTASYTVSQALPLELPRAQTGETKQTALAITIDESGSLYLDGSPVSEADLRLGIDRKKAEGDVSVLIAADGRVRHASVVRVLDLVRSRGVTRFAINVAPEELDP